MVRYVRIVRCPHCNALTDYSNSTRSQLVGNPRRICRKCKRSYFDFSYQEDAIYYYKSNIKPSVAAAPLLKLIDRPPIVNPEKRIDNYFQEELKRDSLISSSLRRLSDPAYLDFLTDNYIDVPQYFFNRIDYVPEISATEKNKMREEKEKRDFEVLKKEQEKFITASHYLQPGMRNATFKAVAREVGMTPEKFKAYCQSVVDNYESIHREYNSTHRIPAQFPEIP